MSEAQLQLTRYELEEIEWAIDTARDANRRSLDADESVLTKVREALAKVKES